MKMIEFISVMLGKLYNHRIYCNLIASFSAVIQWPIFHVRIIIWSICLFEFYCIFAFSITLAVYTIRVPNVCGSLHWSD